MLENGKSIFVLPYLADYRVVFFDRLTERLGGDLLIAHPPKPRDSSVRVADHPGSVHVNAVRGLPLGFESQKDLVRQILRMRPRAVCVEADVRNLAYLRLVYACRLRRIPVAIWGLGRYQRERSALETVAGAVMTWLYVSGANEVIGKGSGPATYYSSFTLRKSKVKYAPNSTGTEEMFLQIPLDRRGESSNPTLRVLFVGRVTAAKAVDVLVRGLSQLTSPWELKIVGDGPDVERVRSVAGAADVISHVHFLGAQRGDELMESFREADVLALPGKGGLVVPEALAAGLPVVCSDLFHAGDGTLDEVLEDGVNAFIAKGNRPVDLAEALGRAASEMALDGLRTYREQSRLAFRRRGGVDDMTEVFANFFRFAPPRK